MDKLSDELLIEALIQAKKLQLDLDFIAVLEEEIKRRERISFNEVGK